MAIFGFVTKREHEKLLRELEALKAQLPFERWQLAEAEAAKYDIPDPSVYANQADTYRLVSWVLQSVDAVATACALTDFEVKRVVQDKEPVDIPNHPFELLLRHPNPLDSRFEFLYATVAYWILNGNSYWWLNRKDENSPPDELWVIPPSQITPIPDNNMYLRGYYYEPGNSVKLFLPVHEIVHFRNFNPRPSRFVGLSKLESIATVAQGDLSMSDWNTRLFRDNNARLASILTFEQMIADPTWEKIKADTREAARKREMLMLRGVGAGGVNWLQNSVSQKDMEFLSGRRANKEEIMGTLAPGLYAWLSSESTYSNANSNRAAFNELAVYPIHCMMAEKITNSILPAYPGRPLIGKFEDVRIYDRALQLREQEMYQQVHTLAEVREKYYGEQPLGDERDNLLPSQITAASGVKQEAPITPPMAATNDTRNQSDGMSDAEKRALATWKRYAQRVGAKRALTFEHPSLSPAVKMKVSERLQSCRDDELDDVFDAFDTTPRDAVAVLEGIRLALERL